jgi:adenylate cyclase
VVVIGNGHDERRLVAILAADIVGLQSPDGGQRAGTLAQLKTHRKDFIDPKIAEYGGRIVKTTGDGMLVEYVSAADAVQQDV